MRLNPCELEIDLFCRGLEIDPSCDLASDGRDVSRTRAGLGSGLDLVLAGAPPLDREIWMNVPMGESFVAATPYLLRRSDGYQVLDRRTGEVYSARLPSAPPWYARKTAGGVAMASIGVLQGTYLGVYVGAACRFWHSDAELACRFCTTGLNIDADVPRTVENVVETACAAKEESGATFVHLNTGFQSGGGYRLMAPFVEALKKRVGILVGVQAAPEGTREELDRLIDLGVDHFSFCFEYYDPEHFRRFCPGKHERIGQHRFFQDLEHCQSRLPRGACSGEIIAGNEPVEKTLEAIDYITGIGAFPTICIFRPLEGSAMEDWAPPQFESMRRVMKHMWDRCRDRRIPIGLAPNIEVSLVVQPADAAYLADGTWKDRWYRLRNALMRRLAAPAFRRRMRAVRCHGDGQGRQG